MTKVSNIIKLCSRGIGKNSIAEWLSLLKNTVKTYIKIFLKFDKPIDELLQMSDLDLNNLLNRPSKPSVSLRFQKLQEFFRS